MLATFQRIGSFFGSCKKIAKLKTTNELKTEKIVSDNGELDSGVWQTINIDIEPVEENEQITVVDKPKQSSIDSSSNKIKSFASRFISRNEYVVNDDISNGCEKNKIPALSYKHNDKAPSDYHYVSDYIESKPVCIDRSLAILSNCKCLNEESCNSGYCSCSANYISGRYYNSGGRLSSDYNFQIPQPIYECNPSCKCHKSNCKNMVIQRGCQLKLILYRTKSRGWGVRTTEPLKRGTFVGIYSGELISGMESLKRKDDTYLFNLSTKDISYQQTVYENRSKQEEEIKNNDNNNNSEIISQQETNNEVITSSYIIQQFVCDAKKFGNITRFINHSCDPNVTGIRSFTKHHDQRFPYIAFFTNQDIKANQELTLNYGDNYWLIKCRRDKIYCLCKSSRCRFSKERFKSSSAVRR